MNENMEQTKPFINYLTVPVMSQERFAELSGVSMGVLEGWIKRGHVPTIKRGKHLLINLVALTHECVESIINED